MKRLVIGVLYCSLMMAAPSEARAVSAASLGAVMGADADAMPRQRMVPAPVSSHTSAAPLSIQLTHELLFGLQEAMAATARLEALLQVCRLADTMA